MPINLSIPDQITPDYCPCFYTKKLARDFQEKSSLCLVRKGHDKKIFHRVNLAPIHEELRWANALLKDSGSSNILLAKISFLATVLLQNGKTRETEVFFNLKIPGKLTENASGLIKKYGQKKYLLEALKNSYENGKNLINPDDEPHGITPDYSSGKSYELQWIFHTEQMLVAFLQRKEAAEMIHKRLVTQLRAKPQFTQATSVKIRSIGLHIDSTKTCCPACEYTLLGLQNRDSGSPNFLDHFKNACANNRELLCIKPPTKPLPFIVTVGAQELGNGHQKYPACTSSSVAKKSDTYDNINIHSKEASRYIFTTLFDNFFSPDRPTRLDWQDITVWQSGSNPTKGSQGTRDKVKQLSKETLNQYDLSGLAVFEQSI